VARRALHECNRPGCHNLCSTPYCEEHTRPPQPRQDRRPSASKRGYDTLWKKRRDMFLARSENAMCRRCTERGIHGVPSEMVHHRDGNPRNNDESNWEPLCRECHERHHGRLPPPWDANLRLD